MHTIAYEGWAEPGDEDEGGQGGGPDQDHQEQANSHSEDTGPFLLNHSNKIIYFYTMYLQLHLPQYRFLECYSY